MKRLLFLSIMLGIFAVNAQNQPLSIRTYGYGPTDLDSALLLQTDFTYGGNGNITQEVKSNYWDGLNTVVQYHYDQNNRMEFLVELDENEDTVRKEIWLYDAVNKKIEHTVYRNLSGELSPSERTTFIGVNDMNEPEGGVTIEVLNFVNMGIKFRNCTMVTTEVSQEQGEWMTLLTTTPTYGNGRITSATVLPAIEGFEIPIDFTIRMAFSYNVQNKLSRIELSFVPSALPIPIPFATIENSYESNLLVDSIMNVDLSLIATLLGIQIPPFAYRQNITYNSDKTIACISSLYSENTDLNVWTLIQRDWYDYQLSVPSYAKNELKLFPNPTQNVVQITTENDLISTVSIYDLAGKEVLNLLNINDFKVDIAIQDLSLGTYIVKVKTENNVLFQRFVKQ